MEKTKVVFAGIKQVELQTEEVPAISDGQFLVRTEATLISTGTELTCLEANVDPNSAWFNDIKYPMNPGYSLVGKIVSVGKNVPADYVGKRVLPSAATPGSTPLFPTTFPLLRLPSPPWA